MTFLGFIVDRNGLRTDPKKVEAITKYPRPTNRTEVRAFLGITMYYRQFIKKFSEITVPLHKLLKKAQKFEWTEERENTFKKIKYVLCTSSVLARPNWNKKF